MGFAKVRLAQAALGLESAYASPSVSYVQEGT